MIAVYGPWMAELTLEVIGAALYFKRSKIISAYFAVTALMDVATFLIFQNFSRETYVMASWSRHGIRNVMLLWIGCAICGMFLAERNKAQSRITAAFLALAAGAMVTAFAADGDTLKDCLLDAEIAATMILLVFVTVGWISRNRILPNIWKWIAVGFMVLVGSDLLFTGLWTFWGGARHWYPLGAIAAQLTWIAGPLRSFHLPECRANLGVRLKEVQKMGVM